jgi:exonuclease III
VRGKKLELQNWLKDNNIDVCCIQETRLNPDHRFSIRGYETFRRDRTEGHKGGLLTLVKNKHPAAEIHRSPTDEKEVLGIRLLLEGNPLSIYNLYSPLTKLLHFHTIQLEADRWMCNSTST